MQVAQLVPVFESKKSYYGKATIIYCDGETTLCSYESNVLTLSANTLTIYPRVQLSNTTLRHIREFLRQKGVDIEALCKRAKVKNIKGLYGCGAVKFEI